MGMPFVHPSRGGSNVYEFDFPPLVQKLFDSLDTGVARRAKKWFKFDHSELVMMEVDARSYTNADIFARDLLAISLLSKYPKLDLGINTAEVALEGFYNGETQCLETNNRLTRRYDTPTTGVSGDSLIETARQKISRLLGDFSWNHAEPYFGFSGGATTRLRRAHGDSYYKFQGKPDVTSDSALLACCAIERVPNWTRRIRDEFGLDPVNWVNVVKGNTITTVPKNAKTDRVIAIEPDLNMFLQRGVGGLIRAKLLAVGIDLRDQGHNQKLALEGSLTDRLATIDLKAASDTISYKLVERLLPPDWFAALDRLRCRVGTLPSGEVIHYQKFSSMGNGFTFELETLIFWALSKSVVDTYAGTDHRVVVYGDDIIVPSACAGFVLELLQYCGFTSNTKKTHLAGPYRESCGKHYFNGHDVTPFFIREPMDGIENYWLLANNIRRWSDRPRFGVADPRLYGVWSRIVGLVNRRFRVFIPEGIGDGGFIGTFTECSPKLRRGLWVYTVFIQRVGRIVNVFDSYAYLRALSIGGGEEPLDTLLVQREVIKLRKSIAKSSQWEDAPSWCVL